MAGGNLVAHVRMDGAWMGSVQIAIDKAWTSRAFDIATKELAELSQPDKDFFGIHASNNGRVMIFAGRHSAQVGPDRRWRNRREWWGGKQDQASPKPERRRSEPSTASAARRARAGARP
jgi:hypothetical protein